MLKKFENTLLLLSGCYDIIDNISEEIRTHLNDKEYEAFEELLELCEEFYNDFKDKQ